MELLDCILDYQAKFDGKKCQVSTNYKPLATFEIDFRLTDLHHLFGLHKITSEMASKTIPKVLKGDFNLEDYKKKDCFNEVLERISLYAFIGDVFYSNKISYCILGKDLNSNTMKLDVLFFEAEQNRTLILGFRKDKSGVFKPVTLHKTNPRKYSKYRVTKIDKIEWL